MTPIRVLANILAGAGLLLAMNTTAFAQADTEMIVGGEAANQGEFPWQVRLYDTMDDQAGFCGGSIIDPEWILTAAHCLTESNSVVIGYGNVDRTKTTKVEGERIFVHPAYLDGKKADIALVKLSKPIPDAPLVALPSAAEAKELLPPGAKVTVTGWGALWDFPAFDNALVAMTGRKTVSTRSLLKSDELHAPTQLHKVEIEVIDPQACKALYERLRVDAFSIGDSEICATSPTGGKDSCYGDSGGPLVVAKDGNSYQVGVVSWGPQCGNPLTPGVYTRVTSFLDWIDDTKKGN